MTQHSRFSTTRMYSEQPPTRKIRAKVIFSGAFVLISTATWLAHLFVPSLTRNWLWDCGLLLLGFLIGSGSQAFSRCKKWWSSLQTNQEQQETASSSDTSQQTFSLLMWLYSLMMLTTIVTLFVIIPALPQNWSRVCLFFLLGSGGLILWDVSKRRLTTKKIWRRQQKTASGLDTSQRSFSVLIWFCSILEMALVATLLLMPFNGAANTQEFSASLLAGFSVGLFTWLAYRASRDLDE